MPTIPCPHRGNQCDCSETDSPFLNLSAEAPDPPIVLVPVPPRYDPPLDRGGWYKPACATWFYSDISEEEAQLQADIASMNCPDDPVDPPPCDPSVQVCSEGPPGCPDCPPDPGGGGGGGGTVIFPSEERICSVECPDGGIASYYTLPAGAANSPYSPLDANNLADALCAKYAALSPLCFDRDIDPACFGQTYSYQLVATGGTPPYTFNYGPGVPSGLATTDTGLISGWPPASGQFPFNVLVTDSHVPPRSASGMVTLRIVEITTATPLPPLAVGVPYTATLAQTGGDPPLSWLVVSGALPAGLTLDEATGVISGTPTAVPSGPFEVLLQDRAT